MNNRWYRTCESFHAVHKWQLTTKEQSHQQLQEVLERFPHNHYVKVSGQLRSNSGRSILKMQNRNLSYLFSAALFCFPGCQQ